jgi:hypothetical protein
VRHSGKSVLKIVPSSSATFRPWVPLSPECHGLYDTRGSLSSSCAILPQVQHSRNFASLIVKREKMRGGWEKDVDLVQEEDKKIKKKNNKHVSFFFLYIK